MPVTQVEGLTSTLAELSQIEPRLRRQVSKAFRTASQPMVAAARGNLPGVALSNWTTGRYGYDGGAARAGVRIKVGGRSGGSTSFGGLVGSQSVVATVAMTQANAGGAVFDMAGRSSGGASPQGAAFIRNLNSRFGGASRSMWRAAEDEQDNIEAAVSKAVSLVERETNTRLRI